MQYNALPLLNETFVILCSEWKLKSKMVNLTESVNEGKQTTVRGMQDTEVQNYLNGNSRPKKHPQH